MLARCFLYVTLVLVEISSGRQQRIPRGNVASIMRSQPLVCGESLYVLGDIMSGEGGQCERYVQDGVKLRLHRIY